MIFPLPKLSFALTKIPITWLLVAINIFIFVIFQVPNLQGKALMEKILDDEYFYTTQAYVYRKYVESHMESYSVTQQKIMTYDVANKSKARVIASFALSDHEFVNRIKGIDVDGDQVAIADWRIKFNKLLNIQSSLPNYQLGLLANSPWINLVSYQLMHANLGHLISNMIFLLLFGALLENLFGGLLLLLTYFASGVIAALVFLYGSMYINSPLIGASGSVSGIIAAYCLGNLKNNIRFFYFLYIPKAEYMGFVYFPPWILLIYWFLTDLTGYLSQVTEFAGVAYTAHLGGHFAGIIIAFTILFLWRKKPQLKQKEKYKAGELIPLTLFVRRKASSHSVLSDTSRFHKLP